LTRGRRDQKAQQKAVKIAIYEYITGGGCWAEGPDRPPGESLLAEGRAMIQAVAADFAALPNVAVLTSRDARLPPLHPPGCEVTVVGSSAEEAAWLAQACAAADWTLLIAPETGGALLLRCRLVEQAGGRLLSPAAAVVEIASDKQATADLLAAHQVPVPRGKLIQEPADLADLGQLLPVVVKPNDGCGSQGIRIIRSSHELKRLVIDRPLRMEEYVPGLAASVALLAGSAGLWSLPACGQRLKQDGSFAYQGGRLPLAAHLANRATQLAEAAFAALPAARGYLGVDVVLGTAADGSGDSVIEVNPRLTTSYVGLRAASQANLAAAMLAVAEGRAPDLRFGADKIEFSTEGTIAASRNAP
jgi:predicted ATP-grasp superfamily ATP-dependent carboligase